MLGLWVCHEPAVDISAVARSSDAWVDARGSTSNTAHAHACSLYCIDIDPTLLLLAVWNLPWECLSLLETTGKQIFTP